MASDKSRSRFGYREILIQIQQGIDGPLFGCRKIRIPIWLQIWIHIWLQIHIGPEPDSARDRWTPIWLQKDPDPYLASNRYGYRFGFRYIRIQIWLQIYTDPDSARDRWIPIWLQKDPDPYLASDRYGYRFVFR